MPRAGAQIKGLIIAAFRLTMAAIRAVHITSFAILVGSFPLLKTNVKGRKVPHRMVHNGELAARPWQQFEFRK